MFPCAGLPSRQAHPHFPLRFWREPGSQQGGSAGEGVSRSCPAPCPTHASPQHPSPHGGEGGRRRLGCFWRESDRG